MTKEELEAIEKRVEDAKKLERRIKSLRSQLKHLTETPGECLVVPMLLTRKDGSGITQDLFYYEPSRNGSSCGNHLSEVAYEHLDTDDEDLIGEIINSVKIHLDERITKLEAEYASL